MRPVHFPFPHLLCEVLKTSKASMDMHKSECPVCGSSRSVKNGRRKGAQLYKCTDCGYQFRNGSLPDDTRLWHLYQENKQTIRELSVTLGVSESTIKRRLRGISFEWEQPPLSGGGFVHIDATYWGRSRGVIVGLDEDTGMVLYMAFIHSETNADYEAAVNSIKERGYEIRGLIIDGRKSLFRTFSCYKVQMCQFHMRQIVRRSLTMKPRLNAARALKELADRLTVSGRDEFEQGYKAWKDQWRDTLQHRSLLKSGRTQFTHRRLRSAMHSIEFYLPYLFTYQDGSCKGMPNTNNKIEGTFTDLKKNLNNHSGMNEMNRKRFISGFFLALNEALCMKRQDPRQEP